MTRAEAGPAVTVADAPDVVARRQRILLGAWIALLLTAFPWNFTQADAGASGGGGVIEAVKLLVLAAVVALAFLHRERLPTPLPLKLLVAYAAVGLLAALLPPLAANGAFRAVRLALVIVVVGWIARRLEVYQVLRGMFLVAFGLAALALVGQFTGLGLRQDRLYGFLPYLHPNILASLVGLGTVAATVLWLEGRLAHLRALAAAVLMVSVISMTGSRTAMAAMIVGVLIVLGNAFARGVGRTIALVWMGALVLLGAVWTATLTRLDPFAFIGDVFTRGGTAQIDPTLTGRTDAWRLALETDHGEIRAALGQGLQIKTITRKVGNDILEQGIDNSWYSAYIAVGWVGTTILVAAVVLMLVRTVQVRSVTALALLLVVLSGTWTESSLADISFALLSVVGSLVSAAYRTDESGAGRRSVQ